METENTVVLTTSYPTITPAILDQLKVLQEEDCSIALSYLELLDGILTDAVILEEGDPKSLMKFVSKLSHLKLTLKVLACL